MISTGFSCSTASHTVADLAPAEAAPEKGKKGKGKPTAAPAVTGPLRGLRRLNDGWNDMWVDEKMREDKRIVISANEVRLVIDLGLFGRVENAFFKS